MIDFKTILEDIEPSKDDEKRVHDLSHTLMEIIDINAQKEGINAKSTLLGSVAKNTWIISKDSGKDLDIDIFIKFPLSTSLDDLKIKGLELARRCIEEAGGTYEERYASHPYLTGTIKGFQVDIVPCYDIKHGSELKSAVDRTILHTDYVMRNLKKSQEKEVRLLKRFMQMVGTYGSEFKVGGFSGYLCELLVIYYGSFLDVLKGAWEEWKPGYHIDLMNYGTENEFNDPLVVVDPTDKNRNVAAALTLQKMSEFVLASCNFLRKPKKSYFYPKDVVYNRKNILEEFNRRETTSLILTFPAPDIPSDALHPQIRKTEKSLVKILETEDFSVLGSDSWSNADVEDKTTQIVEKDRVNRGNRGENGNRKVFILLEMNTWSLPLFKKRNGPSIWDKKNTVKFLKKHHSSWIEGDVWKTLSKRRYQDVDSLIHGILKPDGISRFRAGKHLKKEILKNYALNDVSDVLNTDNVEEGLLEFLYHYLHKGELLVR
ncbi:MAG: CCA tRNA nucleotidyltransferase [Methanobacteriaceae archaeon]|nr:CCA tRNA nucleotidyltransferase [Methanobacteriaceae archaeon]